MLICLYNENGDAVKEFNLETGKIYNFGIAEASRTFGVLENEESGTILFKLAVDDAHSGEILKAGCTQGLYVNNRSVERSPVRLNDEILADNHLLRLGNPAKLKTYYFLEAKTNEEPIVISEQGTESLIISSILPIDEKPFPEEQELSLDSYSREKTRRQLASLLDFSRELISIFQLEALLDKIIDYLFQVLLIDRGAVVLIEQQEGQRKFRIAHAACRRGLNCVKIAISRTILHTALRDKVAVATSNAQEDPRFRSQGSVLEQEIRSAVCLPLIHKDILLGAIYADSSNPAVSFSLLDLQFLSILANLTSVALQNAVRFTEMETELQGWKSGLRTDKLILGNSAKSRELYDLLRRVANSNVTVLLTGESGTGKELCARAIHQLSSRRSKPLIAINCATLPENLIESELFGYEKGAFTGAYAAKAGKFELAAGGVVFLDEISEIPAPFQVKILRVIEGLGFERVGGTKTLTPDVRLIVATNKNLEEEVKEGRFRADLFWRLKVFPIFLPPLRERREDILLIARFYLKKFARENSRVLEGFTAAAEKWMLNYTWPGNIRQLKNVIECAVLLCDAGPVDVSHLTAHINEVHLGTETVASTEQAKRSVRPLWTQEAESIMQALKQSGWNKSKAARLLGISRHHLIYRMSKYKIEEIADDSLGQ